MLLFVLAGLEPIQPGDAKRASVSDFDLALMVLQKVIRKISSSFFPRLARCLHSQSGRISVCELNSTVCRAAVKYPRFRVFEKVRFPQPSFLRILIELFSDFSHKVLGDLESQHVSLTLPRGVRATQFGQDVLPRDLFI